jgi:hypothetical protein
MVWSVNNLRCGTAEAPGKSRTKSRQQCASESGEVLEIRNRLSFKDHAAVNHEHSVSLDRCAAKKIGTPRIHDRRRS